MGNTFARREGRDPSLPPVFAGSHLDTQSPGGKFDGPLGVLAALEVVRTLDRAGITTRRAIEVVNWTNEEGARFSPGLMGSAVFAGAVDQAMANSRASGMRAMRQWVAARWMRISNCTSSRVPNSRRWASPSAR
jgi:N-carbamoyl-L-amino-acid hydrolase